MYKKILFLCCFYQAAAAQSETTVTVDITMHHLVQNKWAHTPVIQAYLLCYKEYIVEYIPNLDLRKLKSPADIKPPFYTDTSYYLINTDLKKFIPFQALSATAKPDTAAQFLTLKPRGILMEHMAVMDSAVRIADTVVRDTSYIRYRCIKHGPKRNFEITGYLLRTRNTSAYSYHRPTEISASGRFAWVETLDRSDGHYYTTRFRYETKKLPPQALKVMRSWIDKVKWE